MLKKVIGITAVSTLSLFALSGCGNNQTSDSRSSSTASGHSTETSTVQSETSSKKEAVSSSKSEESTSTLSQSQTEESSTADNSSSTSATSNGAAAESPYAVDVAQFTSPTTFTLRGMNVPPSITLVDNGSVTVSFNQQDGSSAHDYGAQVENIPTKEVRVFSNDGNAIRTVKVNTQLTLNSGSGPQANDVLYLITNKSGGYSLITPNYAGNVPSDQMDVMLEAVQ